MGVITDNLDLWSEAVGGTLVLFLGGGAMQNAKKNITRVSGVLRIQFTYTAPTERAIGIGDTRIAPTRRSCWPRWPWAATRRPTSPRRFVPV
jgi:hypothetical protein